MAELFHQELKDMILERIGATIKAKAIRNAPIDQGDLRGKIKHRIEGDTIIIYTEGVDHAEWMEYGTPPHFMGREGVEALTEWAKRHGMDSPWGVIKNIEKNGIVAGTPQSPHIGPTGTKRPFLRSAVYETKGQIKGIVKKTCEEYFA